MYWGKIYTVTCEACENEFFTALEGGGDPRNQTRHDLRCPYCGCGTLVVEENEGIMGFDERDDDGN